MECQLDRITVHYEVRGDGYPILLLHGASLDYRHILNDFEPLFADRPGWQRIYPDLPGHGLTPAPDWIVTQEDVADVVRQFTARVIGSRHFALAGESWGAMLSRPLLQQRFGHVDGVCYIVMPVRWPPVQTEAQDPPPLIANSDLVRQATELDARAGDVMGAQPVQIAQVLNWWIDNSRPAKETLDMAFLNRMFGDDEPLPGFAADIDTLPGPFPGPALFFMGRQDAGIPYQDTWPLIEQYPRASVALLDRAGHLAMVHQRTIFNTMVGEWLDRVQEYRNG